MGVLGQYIYFEIVKTLAPIWGALAFLLFILEWLSQVFRVNLSALMTIELYAYKIPLHLQFTFPIAVLMALLVVLGGMNKNREIVAAQSLGINRRHILLPCFFAVLTGALGAYWVSDRLAPFFLKKHFELYDVEVEKVPSRFSQIRQEKIWYRNRDVLYNVRYLSTEKDELIDVKIYTFDENFNIAQTIFASRAEYTGRNWKLFNGTVSITDKRLEVPVIEPFVVRETRLIEAPSILRRVEIGPETMNQSELAKNIRRSKSLGVNTSRLETIYHARLSFLFVAVVFLFLAFPMSMKFQRVSSWARDGVVVVAISLVYWMVYNFGVNMGSVGKVHPFVAAWSPSFIFCIGIYLYNRTQDLKALSD
jgi:lipopolysaccharide export system permease protein